MKFFGYEVISDDEHSRVIKVESDIEEGTATINKETMKITFHNFSKSFDHLLPKAFVEKFLRDSIKNFPEKKSFAFGS